MTVPTLEYKDCAPIGAFEYKGSSTTMAEYAVKSAVLNVPNPLDPAQAGLGNAPVGEVQFYAAVTGVKDAVGDIIVPGAFGRTLGERLPRVCLGHDWNRPIGRTVEVKELMPGDPGLPATTATGKPWPREAGALYVKALYNLGTKDGRNAFSDAQFMGRSAMYSIGYVAKEKEQKGDTRYLHDLDLWEYGPVLHPANDLASGISAKGGEPDNLETKARHVRDADFWGLPIGTAIRPGMRPRGKVAVAMRRRGEVPDRNAGTMDRAPDPAQRAELESQQAGRSTSRAITDIRSESDGAGLFDTPQRQGTVRAARSARGADQEHLDAVHGDAEREDESTAINGRDRSDLAVHELTTQQREGLRGLLDEGITPDEVDEELPDDIDADHRASIMQAYRHAYAQRAEQQGQGGGTGRSPEVDQPAAPQSFGQAAAAARGQAAGTATPVPAPRPGPTVDDPAANRSGLADALHQSTRAKGNVGHPRTVNGARTQLDRIETDAPREHHGPVAAAVKMGHGMLARGADDDPARQVRGLRQAMTASGIDDHEMGRRFDAIDAVADVLERQGLGGVKGKGRQKPTAQAMRDYAAAGRAETGIEPETDYRHLRDGGADGVDRGNGEAGRDVGGGAPAPGSQSSATPSADRAAAEQIAPNRGLGGSPQDVAARLAQNEQARAGAGMSDPSDPASRISPARAQQIAEQFYARQAGRGERTGRPRGTVQDAGRYTDEELEAAARHLDGLSAGAGVRRDNDGASRAAAGLRDFVNHRNAEQRRRDEARAAPAPSPDPRESPEMRGERPELSERNQRQLDRITALDDTDAMRRARNGLEQRERASQRGGYESGARKQERAEQREIVRRIDEAIAEREQRDPAASDVAGPATDIDEARARGARLDGGGSTARGPAAAPPADHAQRASDAIEHSDQDALADALADAGVRNPDDRADSIMAARGGKRRQQAAARDAIASASAPSAGNEQAAARVERDTAGTVGEDAGRRNAADLRATPDELEARYGGAPGPMRSGHGAAREFVDAHATGDDGEAEPGRDRIQHYVDGGNQRELLRTDDRSSPTVPDGVKADAALGRKVGLGELTVEQAEDVRRGSGDPERPYASEVRPGDVIADPGTGEPARVHTIGMDTSGNLVLRATGQGSQGSIEVVSSPADRVERDVRPEGGERPIPDLDNLPGDGSGATEDVSADDVDAAAAESDAYEAQRVGITGETPDGEVEVTDEVAERQARVQGLLTRAAGGRLNVAAMDDQRLGSTRRDLVDELALQNVMRRRSPDAGRDGGGRGARSGGAGGAGGGDAAPARRQRPGVAGAAEDYAEAIESGEGVDEARARLASSLRRSSANGPAITAMRDHLAGEGDDDPAELRRHAHAMRAETRTRRNDAAKRRRTAKRIERERLRSLIGQVDTEMRGRGMNPDEHGGAVPRDEAADTVDAPGAPSASSAADTGREVGGAASSGDATEDITSPPAADEPVADSSATVSSVSPMMSPTRDEAAVPDAQQTPDVGTPEGMISSLRAVAAQPSDGTRGTEQRRGAAESALRTMGVTGDNDTPDPKLHARGTTPGGVLATRNGDDNRAYSKQFTLRDAGSGMPIGIEGRLRQIATMDGSGPGDQDRLIPNSKRKANTLIDAIHTNVRDVDGNPPPLGDPNADWSTWRDRDGFNIRESVLANAVPQYLDSIGASKEAAELRRQTDERRAELRARGESPSEPQLPDVGESDSDDEVSAADVAAASTDVDAPDHAAAVERVAGVRSLDRMRTGEQTFGPMGDDDLAAVRDEAMRQHGDARAAGDHGRANALEDAAVMAENTRRRRSGESPVVRLAPPPEVDPAAEMAAPQLRENARAREARAAAPTAPPAPSEPDTRSGLQRSIDALAARRAREQRAAARRARQGEPQQRAGLDDEGNATGRALNAAMTVQPRAMDDRDGLTRADDPQPGDIVMIPGQTRMRGAVVIGHTGNRVQVEFSTPSGAAGHIQRTGQDPFSADSHPGSVRKTLSRDEVYDVPGGAPSLDDAAPPPRAPERTPGTGGGRRGAGVEEAGDGDSVSFGDLAEGDRVVLGNLAGRSPSARQRIYVVQRPEPSRRSPRSRGEQRRVLFHAEGNEGDLLQLDHDTGKQVRRAPSVPDEPDAPGAPDIEPVGDGELPDIDAVARRPRAEQRAALDVLSPAQRDRLRETNDAEIDRLQGRARVRETPELERRQRFGRVLAEPGYGGDGDTSRHDATPRATERMNADGRDKTGAPLPDDEAAAARERHDLAMGPRDRNRNLLERGGRIADTGNFYGGGYTQGQARALSDDDLAAEHAHAEAQVARFEGARHNDAEQDRAAARRHLDNVRGEHERRQSVARRQGERARRNAERPAPPVDQRTPGQRIGDATGVALGERLKRLSDDELVTLLEDRDVGDRRRRSAIARAVSRERDRRYDQAQRDAAGPDQAPTGTDVPDIEPISDGEPERAPLDLDALRATTGKRDVTPDESSATVSGVTDGLDDESPAALRERVAEPDVPATPRAVGDMTDEELRAEQEPLGPAMAAGGPDSMTAYRRSREIDDEQERRRRASGTNLLAPQSYVDLDTGEERGPNKRDQAAALRAHGGRGTARRARELEAEADREDAAARERGETPNYAAGTTEDDGFVDRWLDMGAPPNRVADLIQGDLRQAHAAGGDDEGRNPYEAQQLAQLRLARLRERSGHRSVIPTQIAQSIQFGPESRPPRGYVLDRDRPSTPEVPRRPAPYSEEQAARGRRMAAIVRRVESGNPLPGDHDEYEEYMEARGNARRNARGDDDRDGMRREAQRLPATMTQAEADAYQQENSLDAGQMARLNRARRELGMEPVGREHVAGRPGTGGRTVLQNVEDARSGRARDAVLADLDDTDLQQLAEHMERYNRESPRGDPYRNRRQANAYDKRERVARDARNALERREQARTVPEPDRPLEELPDDELRAHNEALRTAIGLAPQGRDGADQRAALRSRSDAARDEMHRRSVAEMNGRGRGDTISPEELDAAGADIDTTPSSAGSDLPLDRRTGARRGTAKALGVEPGDRVTLYEGGSPDGPRGEPFEGTFSRSSGSGIVTHDDGRRRATGGHASVVWMRKHDSDADAAPARFPGRVDLIHHREDGSRSVVEGITPAKARTFSAQALADNGHASRSDAQQFASDLPFDRRVDHPGGRGFEIVRAGEGHQRAGLNAPERAPAAPAAPAAPVRAADSDDPDVRRFAGLRARNSRALAEEIGRRNDEQRREARAAGNNRVESYDVDPALPELVAGQHAHDLLTSGRRNMGAAQIAQRMEQDGIRARPGSFDSSVGDAQADAMDRLADNLDSAGVGGLNHSSATRAGIGGVADEMRAAATEYRRRRDEREGRSDAMTQARGALREAGGDPERAQAILAERAASTTTPSGAPRVPRNRQTRLSDKARLGAEIAFEHDSMDPATDPDALRSLGGYVDDGRLHVVDHRAALATIDNHLEILDGNLNPPDAAMKPTGDEAQRYRSERNAFRTLRSAVEKMPED